MIKKQLIIKNAIELFAEQGFEATSIQQITDKCGISKGAFYLSFKSKDELIFSLIDYFMTEVVADIEQVVNSERPASQLLYDYYTETFNTFKKHANFARIFMKEHRTTFNVEIFEKIDSYMFILNRLVHEIVKKQFPHIADQMVSDLVFTIQAFSRDYGELFLKHQVDIDIDVLCRSLVEKISIITEHATIPFFSVEWMREMNTCSIKLTKNELIQFLQQKRTEFDDTLIQDSIELLRNHLVNPSLSPALEQGLLKNLRANSHSKWIAYIYEVSDKS